ncbi:MAG: hypothetical protein WBB41_13195, partial [Candidatus Nanopelagicales bacterium]
MSECPQCGHVLPAPDADGMLTCTCGFRGYAGYLREYEYLTQRRQWLADRIAEQAPPPDTVTAQAYGIWPAGTA